MALDQSFVGRTYPPSPPYEVGREKIREFADAIGDSDEVYRDPQAARAAGHPEQLARLDALVALIAHVDDTCLLYRGGRAALREARARARAVLAGGGSATVAGRRALQLLEAALMRQRASPGGSADLLAGALLLDGLHDAAHGGENVPEEVA